MRLLDGRMGDGDRGAALRLFLGLFAGLSLVLLALWGVPHYVDAMLENGRQRLAARDAVERTRDALGKALLDNAADLKIVAEGRALRRLAAGDAASAAAAAEDFAAVVREKAYVAGLRVFTAAGTPLVRVDEGPAGSAVVVAPPPAAPADHAVVEQAAGLPEGGLFITSITFGAAGGTAGEGTGARPRLRLASPVAGDGRAGQAVVVADIAVGDLLASVGPPRPADPTPLQLLDRTGRWLAGAPPERPRADGPGGDATMAAEDPDAWRRITAAPSGAFEAHGVHHLYRTLDPAAYVATLGGATAVRGDGAAWIVLATVPPVSLAAMASWGSLAILAAGIATAALASLGWTRAVCERRAAEASRRRAEAELVRLERLAGLGALVAGVAHELNTPIGNAVTVASTMEQIAERFAGTVAAGGLRRSVLDGFVAEMRQGSAIVLRGLERANGLIGHFKQVAVDQTSEQRRSFRIAEVIRDIVDTLRPQFRHGAVVLDTELRSDAVLDSYPGALGQVLLNLVGNARIHAFDEGAPGRITVGARDLAPDAVEIVVRDTGRGMAPDLLRHAFEPFVTTRLGQGGSGLGLSVVHSIVTTILGGTVTAQSRPGAGTTMTVRIPVTAPAAADLQPGRTYDVGRSPGRTG